MLAERSYGGLAVELRTFGQTLRGRQQTLYVKTLRIPVKIVWAPTAEHWVDYLRPRRVASGAPDSITYFLSVHPSVLRAIDSTRNAPIYGKETTPTHPAVCNLIVAFSRPLASTSSTASAACSSSTGKSLRSAEEKARST